MTVHVKHGKFRLSLWIPNVFLKMAVKSYVKHESEKNGATVNVDKATIKQMVKILRQAKKIHGKLELVSVKSADGTRVKIRL